MSAPDAQTPGEARWSSGVNEGFETARAIAAINGITLHQFEGDDGRTTYFAAKWNLARELSSLDEVASWLNRVTGHTGVLPTPPNAEVIDEAELARRAAIEEANRRQDALDEAADFLRGPGGGLA